MPSASKKPSLTRCQNSIHAPSSYSPSFHSSPECRGIASPMPSVMIYHLAVWVRRCFSKQTTAIFSLFVHVVTVVSAKWSRIKAHYSWKPLVSLDHVFWVICVCNRNNALSCFLLLLAPRQWRKKSPLVSLFTSKVPSVRQDKLILLSSLSNILPTETGKRKKHIHHRDKELSQTTGIGTDFISLLPSVCSALLFPHFAFPGSFPRSSDWQRVLSTSIRSVRSLLCQCFPPCRLSVTTFVSWHFSQR